MGWPVLVWPIVAFILKIMRKSVALLALVACLVGTAQAQFRTLPADMQRGNITGNEYPFVRIDSTTLRLSPGAIIWDQNNRTITPNFLPAGADVMFSLNNNGEIARIYILTAQEQQQFAR
jgi:hypothetical protein